VTEADPGTSGDERARSPDDRRRRREELAALVRGVGLDPEEVDLSAILDDDTRATLVRRFENLKADREEAARLGRDALRVRFARSVRRAVEGGAASDTRPLPRDVAT